MALPPTTPLYATPPRGLVHPYCPIRKYRRSYGSKDITMHVVSRRRSGLPPILALVSWWLPPTVASHPAEGSKWGRLVEPHAPHMRRRPGPAWPRRHMGHIMRRISHQLLPGAQLIPPNSNPITYAITIRLFSTRGHLGPLRAPPPVEIPAAAIAWRTHGFEIPLLVGACCQLQGRNGLGPVAPL